MDLQDANEGSKEETDVYLKAPSLIETTQRGGHEKQWSSGASLGTILEVDNVIEASTVSIDFSELTDTSEKGVQDYVDFAMGQLEKKLERILDSISEELNSEVNLERQHLVLMQQKVDNQGQTLQKEFNELHKKMTQESTIRAMVQQKYREQNEALDVHLQCLSKELTELKNTVNNLQQPWMYQALSSVFSLFQQCTPVSCQYTQLPDNQP